MADIFISYAAEDRKLGARLASELAERGFSVWWDYELLGGQRFREVIEQELKAAKCAIVIWTPKSVRSHFVQDEADLARRQDKLIPVISDDLERAALPLGFGQLQTLRLNAFEQIMRAAERFVRPQTAEATHRDARLTEIARRLEIELKKSPRRQATMPG